MRWLSSLLLAGLLVVQTGTVAAAPPQNDLLISRVFQLKSEDAQLDDLADPSSFGDLDENDPKSVARWARKLGQQMGEDLGDDWGEMVDKLEAGEDLGDEGMGGPPDSDGIGAGSSDDL